MKFNLCVCEEFLTTRTLRQGPPLQENVGKIVAQFNRSKPTWSIGEVAAEGHFFVPPPGKKNERFSLIFLSRFIKVRTECDASKRESRISLSNSIAIFFKLSAPPTRISFFEATKSKQSGDTFLINYAHKFSDWEEEGMSQTAHDSGAIMRKLIIFSTRRNEGEKNYGSNKRDCVPSTIGAPGIY